MEQMQTTTGGQAAPDLSNLEDAFEHSEVEEREFEEPPDGKYQVQVARVELTRSKTTQTPMLKWQLKILGPKCAGRFLFRNNMISSADNVKWLKNDLATCGMDVAHMKLSDLPNRLGELLDVTLEVQKRAKGEFTSIFLNRRIQIDTPQGFNPGSHAQADEVLPF